MSTSQKTVTQASETAPIKLAPRSSTSIAARAARVNAHLQGQTRQVRQRSTKPCYAFFGRDRFCERGQDCGFSHDPENFDAEAYKAERGLIDCPRGCGNYCRESSNQCSSCVQTLYDQRNQERNARQAEFESRPEQPCKGSWLSADGNRVYCGTMTKFRLCHPCKKDFDERPEEQCKGSWRDSNGEQVLCQNTSRYRLCPSCHNTEKQYTIRR